MADLNSTIVRGNLRVTEEIIGPLNVTNLSAGTNGQFLSVSNNVPTWVNNPNTNTWRKVQLNGADKLGAGIDTNPLNIKAGSNMTITESNGTFTFAATDTNTDTKVTAVGNHYAPANGTDLTVSSSGTATRGSTKVLTNIAIDAAGHITGGTWYTLPASDNTDTDTHYTNYLQIKGNGTEAIKFTQNADKTLNLKPGNNVSISAGSGEITISAAWRPLGTGKDDAAAGNHAHSSVADVYNNKTTTFAYSQDGLGYDNYTWLAGWNNYELRAVNKSQFARASHSHTISDTTNLQATLDGKVNSSDLVALTLTNNSTKRYLIGSTSATSWSGVGTNSSCYTSSGNLYATYFYGTSDRRLKENIKDLDLNCLDLVNNINLREFSWKADETHKPVIGAIAQELNQVLPEKYRHEFIGGQETKDEYLSINDSKLVYLLIGAIQEQQKEIESLKAKIDGKIV